MSADHSSNEPLPREGFIPAGSAELYFRVIGQGQPLLLLHGGPDFDHTYLLPDMDRLADAFRLIYYDQRGRGKSAKGVLAEDVNLRSEIEDLDRVLGSFQMDRAALLGHSWGALLALEYAIRHPERVSHLIILNTAPVSHEDYLLLRSERRRNSPADIAELIARAAAPDYRQGDPDAVANYYRVHFRATVRRPEQIEQVVASLRSSFTQDGILKARAVEKRLMSETWFQNDYNLLPKLEDLDIPALVLHGNYDFVPEACALHIAQAIPGARFVVLKDCGHFSYIECADEVRREIDAFFQSTQG